MQKTLASLQRGVRWIDYCPWLNKEIKSVMRQRDYFHSKAKKTNLSEDWASYRCYRNRASNAIKRAKAVYNRRLLENSGNDHKAFWRTMKKTLPGKRKNASSNISIGGTPTSDKNLIADSFNKFFTSSVTRLLESVRSCGVSGGSPSQSVPPCRYPDFKFAVVSEAYVRSQLRRLKPGKAVGLNIIPARLLVHSIVASPLTAIINISLQSGVVSLEWKAARIMPLLRKGKSDDMDYYRPISILSAVSMVLERAVHHQLYAYLQSHKVLSPYQCGFLKCHSPKWAGMCFADTICRNIDQGRLTGAVFIDLRKAFDIVNHEVFKYSLRVLSFYIRYE